MEFDRIIRMREVRQLIGLSASTIYRTIKSGEFPKQIGIGEKSSGWRMSTIQNWTKSKETSAEK